MHTLVLYHTRHGFTEKCARLLEEYLNGQVTLKPLAQFESFDGYDGVLLGGPVYHGRWHRVLTTFCRYRAQALAERPYGLFVTSLSGHAAAEAYLRRAVPPEVYDRARVRGWFGGGADWPSLTWTERLILRTKGLKGPVSNLDLNEIQRTAAGLYA